MLGEETKESKTEETRKRKQRPSGFNIMRFFSEELLLSLPLEYCQYGLVGVGHGAGGLLWEGIGF